MLVRGLVVHLARPPYTHFALQLRQRAGRVRQLLLQIADAPVGHLHAGYHMGKQPHIPKHRASGAAPAAYSAQALLSYRNPGIPTQPETRSFFCLPRRRTVSLHPPPGRPSAQPHVKPRPTSPAQNTPSHSLSQGQRLGQSTHLQVGRQRVRLGLQVSAHGLQLAVGGLQLLQARLGALRGGG